MRLMLPLELCPAGVNHVWNGLRRQWLLPYAISARSDASWTKQNLSTSRRLRRTLPAQGTSDSSTNWTIPHSKGEQNIHPESLQDTLEAHRYANRASLIHKRISDTVKDQDAGIFRPNIVSVVRQDQTPEEQGATHKTLKETRNSSPSEQNGRASVSPRLYINYRGCSQQPKDEWKLPFGTGSWRNKMRPWLAYLDRSKMTSEDVYDWLTAEILAFEKYMETTASVKAAVEKAVSDVRKAVALVDPAIKVSVLGSRSTGLAMPLSDIDIGLEHPDSPDEDPGQQGPSSPDQSAIREQRIVQLVRVIRKLRKRGGPKASVFNQLALIAAKVPIIHALHVATRLEIQIQIQSAIAGNTNTEMVRAYTTEYPTLRPLFLVLRQVLKMRGLGEPRTHGIGSYTLIMMIVATLKFSSSRFDRRDAGRQLLYFLDFYTKMDFTKTGIAVDPPELFPKRPRPSLSSHITTKIKVAGVLPAEEVATMEANSASMNPSLGRLYINRIHEGRPYLMCLEDPANTFNDLGSQAAAIKHVQATFATLATKMKTSMDIFEKRTRKTSATFSLLDPCLAGNYTRFEEKRQALENLGAKLVEVPVVAEYL